jgi:hypothetical protein
VGVPGKLLDEAVVVAPDERFVKAVGAPDKLLEEAVLVVGTLWRLAGGFSGTCAAGHNLAMWSRLMGIARGSGRLSALQ